MKKHTRDRWLINLGLLIGIATLSIILLLGKQPEPVKKTLADYLPTDISSITITREGRADISISKQGSHWRMLTPYEIYADDFQVNNLLGLTHMEIHTELDATAINQAEFGLVSPKTVLQLDDTRIMLGDTQPIGKQRYIQIGERVLLIDDSLSVQLTTGSLSMVDRHLLPPGGKLNSVTIDKLPSITLGQDDQATAIINQWLAIKANWISLYAEKKVGGIPVQLQLEPNGTFITYHVQRREADLVLIRDDMNLEYHLPLTAIEALGLSSITSASNASPTSGTIPDTLPGQDQ